VETNKDHLFIWSCFTCSSHRTCFTTDILH